MTIEDLGDDQRLFLGPARNAELLEIVTVTRGSKSDLVIHATTMRDKYLRLLPEE